MGGGCGVSALETATASVLALPAARSLVLEKGAIYIKNHAN
jgi:hypothetical protein